MRPWQLVMNRPVAVALAALVLVASVAAAVSVVGAAGGPDAGQARAASGGGVAPAATNWSAPLPGSQYASVVSAQGAEVESTYYDQAFSVRLANATTNDSRAAVVASEVTAIRARLTQLESRRAALANASDEALEDGEESARVTQLVAQSRALAGRIDRVEAVAATLPQPVRERYDVTASTFSSLRDRADALTTREMEETATQLAGEDVGESLDEEDDDEDDEQTDGDGDSEADGGDGTDSGTDGDGGESGDGTDSGDGTESGDGDGT